MSLRLGVDLDGTLADLSSAYHACEQRMFGSTSADAVEPPAEAEAEPRDETDVADDRLKRARQRSLRQEHVWRTIKQTPDFWLGLQPIEDGIIARLYDTAVRGGWEVFFITQRPATAGLTVQMQSQRWLIEHGFPTPSVVTLSGSRGKAASALELDYLIDDTPKNCVDVISDSRCRPLLVLRSPDPSAEESARRLSIGVVRTVSEALTRVAAKPAPADTLMTRLTRRLGWP